MQDASAQGTSDHKELTEVFISFVHTAAEVGIVLAIMHMLGMWLAKTPFGGAIAFVYGT